MPRHHQRIHSSRLYRVEYHYKSNGEWYTETLIVAGYAMRPGGYHLEPHREYSPAPEDRYRLHTGRLPEYQPIVTGDKLREAMVLTRPPVASIASPLDGSEPMA